MTAVSNECHWFTSQWCVSWRYVFIMSLRVTPCCCLNVKELLARNRRHIWRLSGSNGIRIHNHLVHKRTLNHLAKLANLAKWLIVNLRTKCLWVRIPLMCFLVETPEYFNAALFYYCKENFIAAIWKFFWKYY